MGALANEATVQVWIASTPFNGVEPNWGSVASILCIMKNWDTNFRATKRDAGGACNTRQRNRYGKTGATFRIGALIPTGDFSFVNLNGPMVKYPIRIETKTLSTLATPRVWTGVIEEWSWTGADEEPQGENITVDLTPDW